MQLDGLKDARHLYFDSLKKLVNQEKVIESRETALKRRLEAADAGESQLDASERSLLALEKEPVTEGREEIGAGKAKSRPLVAQTEGQAEAAEEVVDDLEGLRLGLNATHPGLRAIGEVFQAPSDGARKPITENLKVIKESLITMLAETESYEETIAQRASSGLVLDQSTCENLVATMESVRALRDLDAHRFETEDERAESSRSLQDTATSSGVPEALRHLEEAVERRTLIRQATESWTS